MSAISGIHSYNPCRFIGATLTAFVNDASLKEKIVVLATSVFSGIACFFSCHFFLIPFSFALPVSMGFSLLTLFELAVAFGHTIIASQEERLQRSGMLS